MPTIDQLLKSVQSHPEIKNRLKTLFQKSSSCFLYNKISSNFNFSFGDLPSGSIRSFQLEFQRFSGRTSEAGDTGKPLSVSEAASRVFATPSVHGPAWQSFCYPTYQVLLDEKHTGTLKQPIPLTLALFESRTTRHTFRKFESTFHTLNIDIHKESGISTITSLSSQRGHALWEEEIKNLPLRTCKQLEFLNIPKLSCFELKNVEENHQKPERKIELRKCEEEEEDFPEFSRLRSNDFATFTHEIFLKQISATADDIKVTNAINGVDFFVERKTHSFGQDESVQRNLSCKGLRLVSGACYFPHPDKVLTGGEDAYFICPERQVIGVADGVGGWSDMGVDAGEYARRLMGEAFIAAQEEPAGCVNAARILEKAHSKTMCRGSSTACIVALSDNGLKAINLGDSGFLVVRNGRIYFKSPPQQHNFNLPYQLERFGGDPISAAELFCLDVNVGDVIIAGTDGLFDNLYATEVASLVAHATFSGMSSHATAQKIACMAQERSKDRNRQTPFSAAAQDAGFFFFGGKMDDITVIVSYVTDSSTFRSGKIGCLM